MGAESIATDQPALWAEKVSKGFAKIVTCMCKRKPMIANDARKPGQETGDARSKTFNSSTGKAPKISLLNYVKRIWHFGLERREEMLPCFGGALVLVRRMARIIKLTPLNMHRIVALCFLVVTKHSTDHYGGDRLWASVLGIDASELKQLEESFYDTIDCEVEVLPEEVEKSMREMVHVDVLQERCKNEQEQNMSALDASRQCGKQRQCKKPVNHGVTNRPSTFQPEVPTKNKKERGPRCSVTASTCTVLGLLQSSGTVLGMLQHTNVVS